MSEIDLLKKFEDAAAACNRCGYCTSYCPTYVASGNEAYSPRGRVQTFRMMLEGAQEDPGQSKDIVDTCLLCGECTSVCFSGVPTADLMVQARHYLNKKEGIHPFLKFFLGKVLFRPGTLNWVLRVLFLGKRLGISFLLKKTGLLKMISPALSNADDLIASPPVRFLKDHKETAHHQEKALKKEAHEILFAQKKMEEFKKKGKPVSPELQGQALKERRKPKVAYMSVCGSQYLRPGIGLSTLSLLKSTERDFIIPENMCCGLPAASYGVLDLVKDVAKQNIKKFETAGYETIVCDDSSCFSHLRDYPDYFEGDSEWTRRAQVMCQKFCDLSTHLVQRGYQEILAGKRWNGGSVAFHDPCKAQYAEKATTAPRTLLKAVQGLELVPVPEADQCCGGAGTYSFVHVEMSKQVLDAKVKNIISTGCKTVVTSSTSCLTQIASGLRKNHPDVEVMHISEFLAGL